MAVEQLPIVRLRRVRTGAGERAQGVRTQKMVPDKRMMRTPIDILYV